MLDHHPLVEPSAGPYQRDQVGAVDCPPAVLGGLQQLEGHQQPGGLAAGSLGHAGPQPASPSSPALPRRSPHLGWSSRRYVALSRSRAVHNFRSYLLRYDWLVQARTEVAAPLRSCELAPPATRPPPAGRRAAGVAALAVVLSVPRRVRTSSEHHTSRSRPLAWRPRRWIDSLPSRRHDAAGKSGEWRVRGGPMTGSEVRYVNSGGIHIAYRV